MLNWSNMRHSLFANPYKTSAAVWTSATFIFLIPTCIKLTPLGNEERHAKSERDDAQAAYDQTAKQLAIINNQIKEAKQRVIDLDCAMAGYQQFNQGVAAFQQSINYPVKTPMNQLELLWKIYFNPDKNVNEQHEEAKSWDEEVWKYDYYYSCIWHSCEQGKSCCYDWGHHYVSEPHYYNQITTILNKYQGIIQGTPLRLIPLDCGYYSRKFETLAPTTYVTYKSPPIETGNKWAGTTYIDFYKEWGSKTGAFYQLDDTKRNYEALVLRTPNQNDASADLAQKLYAFLTTAIAAFNMAGANYSQVQESIRKQIPRLMDNAAHINEQLASDALLLADKDRVYQESDGDFTKGATLWLNLFFLIPGGLALLTLLYLKCSAHKSDTDNQLIDRANNQDNFDIERPAIARPASPVRTEGYSPAHFAPSTYQNEGQPDTQPSAPPAYSN